MPLWNVRDVFLIWVQDTHSTPHIFWLFCVMSTLWAHLHITWRDMHNTVRGPRAGIIYICMFIPMRLGTCVMPLWNVRDASFIWVQDTHSTPHMFWFFVLLVHSGHIYTSPEEISTILFGVHAQVLYTYVCCFPWDWEHEWCHYEMSEMFFRLGSGHALHPHIFSLFFVLFLCLLCCEDTLGTFAFSVCGIARICFGLDTLEKPEASSRRRHSIYSIAFSVF